jgi:hypothetical protein
MRDLPILTNGKRIGDFRVREVLDLHTLKDPAFDHLLDDLINQVMGSMDAPEQMPAGSTTACPLKVPGARYIWTGSQYVPHPDEPARPVVRFWSRGE